MDDLISRQMELDALRTWDQSKMYLPSDFRELVEGLPSAQSEIVVEISKDATDVMESVVRLARALAKVLESEGRQDDAEIH